MEETAKPMKQIMADMHNVLLNSNLKCADMLPLLAYYAASEIYGLAIANGLEVSDVMSPFCAILSDTLATLVTNDSKNG